jgi:hypothetical protein
MVLAIVLSAPVVLVASGTQDAPPMPKPGPEHEVLKMDEGTWDATLELTPGPGAPPMTSNGVEVNTIGCGGMCLITDFKGELMKGTTFHGHGVTTWDSVKKKYAGSWTDSMSRGLSQSEGSWDPAKKRATGTMEGPDMTGTVVKTRTVVEYPTPGTRVMTAFMAGPDGKELQIMKITYKRRK